MPTKLKSSVFDYKRMQELCILFTAGTQVNECLYEGTSGCMEIHIHMGEYGYFSAGDWNSVDQTGKWFDSTCVLKKILFGELGRKLGKKQD